MVLYFFIIFPVAKGEFDTPHAREQLRSLESNETGTISTAAFIDSVVYLAEQSEAKQIVTSVIQYLSSFFKATNNLSIV